MEPHMNGVDDLLTKLFAQYAVACKKCGSTNVVFHVVEGRDYGGLTGYCSGTTTVGCNDCKANDVIEYI
jgi:hypothetical protein